MLRRAAATVPMTFDPDDFRICGGRSGRELCCYGNNPAPSVVDLLAMLHQAHFTRGHMT